MTADTMGENSLDVANVKVAVRVRPFNRRGEWIMFDYYYVKPL